MFGALSSYFIIVNDVFVIISHQAPLVKGESVQKIKAEITGESFKMTEERKVMFKHYNPLTFIQTDKPIYNPGQTGKL